MSPFWAGLFENLRERGRNATLFLVALAALVGLLVLGAVLERILRSVDIDADAARVVLALAALAAAALLVRGMRRAFFGPRGRSSISRLSSDELTKARSKLQRNRNRSSV